MYERNNSAPSPAGLPAGVTKEEYTRVLGILIKMHPRQRRFLKDFPACLTEDLPKSKIEADISSLVRMGLASARQAIVTLIQSGEIVRSEIWQAEAYLARYFGF